MCEEGKPGKLILNVSTLFPDLPPHSVPQALAKPPKSKEASIHLFPLSMTHLTTTQLSHGMGLPHIPSQLADHPTSPFLLRILIDLSLSI